MELEEIRRISNQFFLHMILYEFFEFLGDIILQFIGLKDDSLQGSNLDHN